MEGDQDSREYSSYKHLHQPSSSERLCTEADADNAKDPSEGSLEREEFNHTNSNQLHTAKKKKKRKDKHHSVKIKPTQQLPKEEETEE